MLGSSDFRLEAPVLTGMLAALFFLAQELPVSSCELNGKTILVHFTDCPGQSFGIENEGTQAQCWETKQRFVIIGNKVAHYHDEITPEGTIFYIGQRVEVTNDKEQTKRLFSGRDFPQLHQRGWVTADYSVGQLRMQTETRAYFRDDNTLFSTSTHSFVFDIKGDCNSCSLSSMVWASDTQSRSGKRAKLTRLLDKQHSCQVRSGI